MKKTIVIITLFLLLPFLSKAQEENWESLNNKTQMAYNQGSYQKALEYAILAEKQSLKEFGANDSSYFVSLNNLGVVNHALGNYIEAEAYFLKVKDLREKKFGKEHADYALSINNLATLYWSHGKFTKAEAFYKEAMEIRARVVGVKDLAYAESVKDLAALYTDIGKYKEAEELYLKSQQIFANSVGKKSHWYGQILNHLAMLYYHKSRYNESEALLLETLEIYKKTLGENNLDYIVALNGIAVLYYEMGNKETAEILFYEAKDRLEKAVGKENYYYLTILNNLSLIEGYKKNFASAHKLIEEVMGLAEKTIGKNTLEYTTMLTNLATIYFYEKKYEEAILVEIEAKNIIEKIATKKNIGYIKISSNLANTYFEIGKLEESKTLCLETKEIIEQTLGTKQNIYLELIRQLASIYEKSGENTKAAEYYLEANHLNSEKINEYFSFTSEQEKNQVINRIAYDLSAFHSFAFNYKEKNPEFVGYNYNNELRQKGMVLQSEIHLRMAIENSKDTALQNDYNELNTLKNYLKKLYASNAGKEITAPFEQQAQSTEKQLVRNVGTLPEFVELSTKKNADWQAIQKALAPDEMAIEYITFKYRNASNWTDSIFYCALLLRKDYKYPKMIYLFEQNELINVLRNENNIANSPDELYASRGIIKFNPNSQPLNQKLYNLVWKPIETELNSIKHLYLAPSIFLHQVSFAALSIGDSLYLSDKYEVNIVSSTANILDKTTLKAPKNITLYGGIAYEMDTLVMANNSKLYTKQADFLATRAVEEIESTDSWNYLGGTKSEVEQISALFAKKRKKYTLYTSQLASEESFKALSGKKIEALHLATHGFFFNLEQVEANQLNNERILESKNIYKTSKDPLLRSGIILAGANRAWNKKAIPENVEDGILTAYEVSQMNLTDTKLVTLSACQTGLGDIRLGEGVFGLQRAFKMAGVKYLIVSLWEVPDKETVEFMTLFYKNWLKNQEINQAFREAQTTMRKKYPPYYWAAFKLVN